MSQPASVTKTTNSIKSSLASDINGLKEEYNSPNELLTPSHGSLADNAPISNDPEKQTPNPQGDNDPNIVVWEAGDLENPHTWSRARRYVMTIILVSLPFFVNVGTSILSGSGKAIGKEYGVSTEITILITTCFLLGFTCGPLMFGPLSERIGRKIPIVIGVTLFATFCLPIALTQNFYTILISRFFSGVFGSASMSVTGGAIADMWPNPVARGIGMDLFLDAGFLGPMIGPIAGNFITQSSLGWRWTMWITAIFAYTFVIIAFWVLPETYAPVLLTRKAAKLRLKTKNWALHSKAEERNTNFKTFAQAFLVRPWVLLGTEPIYATITLYMGFVYGILFLFFESFPVAFEEVRGWKPQIASLPFAGLCLGVLIAQLLLIHNSLTIYKRQVESTPGVLVPERRLPPMIVAGIVLPIGLFWSAWTSHPSTPWPAQVVATIPVGGSLFTIFTQGFKYIVDVYLYVANSAISGNTFARSFFGAGFPLFALGMYHNLGVPWATSVLAFISLALAPVPVLFYIYGKKIRSYSKNALDPNSS